MVLLRKALILLLVLLVLYVGAFLLLARIQLGGIPLIHRASEVFHWKGGDSWQRFQEYDPAKRHDIIVLGSSHAYRGYDPGLFSDRGIDLFNLGSSGQTAMNARYIAEAYLSSANTGLLIVEVSKSFLMSDGLESTCDLVQNIPDDRAARQMAFTLRDPRAINILALRWVMKGHPPLYKVEAYAGKGYCRYTEEASGVGTADGTPFQADPDQLVHLRELVALCAKRGIPLVLVTHPEPRWKDAAQHEAFRSCVAEQLQGTGVRHIDFGLHHDLDDIRHFADHNHLNQAGVERFVPLLLDSLVNHGHVDPGVARTSLKEVVRE